MEARSITLRLSVEAFERHERAARNAGLTTTAHLAALVEALDPAKIVEMPREDEVATMRARQIAALQAAGVLDDAARVMLMPSRLPPALDRALAQAKRGGPGMRHFGAVLGGLLRTVLPESCDELDEIATIQSRAIGVARLGDLLREQFPIVLTSIDHRHEGAVLEACLTELVATTRAEDSTG